MVSVHLLNCLGHLGSPFALFLRIVGDFIWSFAGRVRPFATNPTRPHPLHLHCIKAAKQTQNPYLAPSKPSAGTKPHFADGTYRENKALYPNLCPPN